MLIKFSKIIKSSLFVRIIKKYNYVFSKNEIIGGKILIAEKHGFLVDIGIDALGYLPYEEFIQKTTLKKKKLKFTPLKIILKNQKSKISDFILIDYKIGDRKSIISLTQMKKSFCLSRLRTLEQENSTIFATIFQSTRKGKILKINQFSLLSSINFKAFVPNNALPKYLKKTYKKNAQLPIKIVNINENKKTPRILVNAKSSYFNWQIKPVKRNETVIGCIMGISNYGLFINVFGIKSLLHISKISKSRIKEPLKKLFKIGDLITVSILFIDYNQGRIILTKKNL